MRVSFSTAKSQDKIILLRHNDRQALGHWKTNGDSGNELCQTTILEKVIIDLLEADDAFPKKVIGHTLVHESDITRCKPIVRPFIYFTKKEGVWTRHSKKVIIAYQSVSR